MRTVESRSTAAGVVFTLTRLTSSTISAGSFITSVDHLDLTVSAGEADGTGAGVVLASVEARGAVVAGSVVGAEVEIFVAHLTSPALLTLTCPGLGTRPVDTAWVDLTLLTSVSLPALVTNALSRLVAISIGITASWGTHRFQTVIVSRRVLIVLLPTLQTYLLSAGSTRVVTKVIMSWLADDVTVSAIVRVATHESVFILQSVIISIHPVRTRVKTLGLGDSVKKLGLIGTGHRIFVIGFNDQTESSRPFEVDIKVDRRSADQEIVGAEHRSDFLAEGAALVEVDGVLVVLETHSELCLAEP